ncbi:hypothetical protein C4552_01440 [Candidatus Parcubacteria bacterium]|nr:MAG: hypothetical protein C4552_01440 [Candidatus Parcubacteria bacterium]
MATAFYVPRPHGMLERTHLFIDTATGIRNLPTRPHRSIFVSGSFNALATNINAATVSARTIKAGAPTVLFFAAFTRHDCADYRHRTCRRQGLWERPFTPLTRPEPLLSHLERHPKFRPISVDRKRIACGTWQLIGYPRLNGALLDSLIELGHFHVLNGEFSSHSAAPA